MTHLTRTALLATVFTLLTLAGCSGRQPIPYQGLSSSPRMIPNAQDESGKVPFVFNTPVNWEDYSSIIVEKPGIYEGQDNQFDGLDRSDKEELGQFMQTEFKKVLSERFTVSNEARPGTLRVRLILTGAKTNTAMVSTVTRFDLLGGPANVVQSIRGKEGVFIGDVSYAVEIYDAQTGKLLKAFVTKQYPNALNVAATFGKLGASKVGLEKGARDLLARLQ